jgi:hypothetical protein
MNFLKFCSLGLAVLAVGSGSCCLQAADHVREPNKVGVMEKLTSLWLREWGNNPPPQIAGNQPAPVVAIVLNDYNGDLDGFHPCTFAFPLSTTRSTTEIENIMKANGAENLDLDNVLECAKLALATVEGEPVVDFAIVYSYGFFPISTYCFEKRFLFCAEKRDDDKALVTFIGERSDGGKTPCEVGSESYNEMMKHYSKIAERTSKGQLK